MNCQEFELIAGELAEDQLMSAKTRVSALAHAKSCEPCARRLANERRLSAGLNTLAERTEGEAPARLKQSLRTAFDAQLARKPVAAPNLVSFPVRPRQWRWALAAAAAAAIVFAVTLSIWLRGSSPNPTEAVATTTPTPTATPFAPAETQLAGQEKTRPERRAPSRRRARAAEDDIAASYIPLTYAANFDEPRDKLIVRVEVLRAALIGMGLPLNAEQGGELVKADLMVGVDGVPLAIRFVKPGEPSRVQ